MRRKLLAPWPWEAAPGDVWAVYVRRVDRPRAFRRGSYANREIAELRAAELRATYAGLPEIARVFVRRARPL